MRPISLRLSLTEHRRRAARPGFLLPFLDDNQTTNNNDTRKEWKEELLLIVLVLFYRGGNLSVKTILCTNIIYEIIVRRHYAKRKWSLVKFSSWKLKSTENVPWGVVVDDIKNNIRGHNNDIRTISFVQNDFV